MHTTVIGLVGGPGCGKSTAAAGLFAYMKNQSRSVELVQEVAKDWAWKKWPITEWDQLHIFGEQVWREAKLYGKVNYIITDSPLVIQAFYESKYTDCTVVKNAVCEFQRWAEKRDVSYLHFPLPRQKEYVTAGRYETEEQAKQIDTEVRKFVEYHAGLRPEVTCPDPDRVTYLYREIVKIEREREARSAS